MFRQLLLNRYVLSSLNTPILNSSQLRILGTCNGRFYSQETMHSGQSPIDSWKQFKNERPSRSFDRKPSYSDDFGKRGGSFKRDDRNRDERNRDDRNRDDRNRDFRSSYRNNNQPWSSSNSDNYGSRNNTRRSFQPRASPIGNYSSFKTEIPYTEAPDLKFSEVKALSPAMQTALQQSFGYEQCTPVQSAIFSKLPIENDILVQAKTGTGKTLAFLVPSLEMISKTVHPYGREARVLILSPTRELAFQINTEAKRLCKSFRYGVQYLVGGESKHRQINSLTRTRSDIVVATPGRILDCLNSSLPVRNVLKNVEILIIDEADRMLEIGFKEDIEQIISYLTNENKRTFLFSATYPKNVKELVESTLKPGYDLINTISPEDVNTVQTIKQSYHVTPMPEQLVQLHSVLQRGTNSGQPFKCIVFWNTSKMTAAMAGVFRECGFRNLYELHGNKDQKQRARVSQTFRTATNGILFTSDVSARGVDYPGVHLVVQMGIPSSKDQYVHRIGRTGRAGKEGESLLFLSPFEEPFLKELTELPLSAAPISESGSVLNLDLLNVSQGDRAASKSALLEAASQVDALDIEDGLITYTGFYQSKLELFNAMRGSKAMFMEEWTQLSQLLGLERPPRLADQVRAVFSVGSFTSPGGKNGMRRNSFSARHGSPRL